MSTSLAHVLLAPSAILPRAVAFMLAVIVLVSGARAFAAAPEEVDVITAAAQMQEHGMKVLDVREPEEFATGVIPGALLIPLGQLEKRLAELAEFKARSMYVVCASGGRSAHAIKVLSNKYGFTGLANIKGGMNAWRKQRLPVVAP